MARNLYRFYLYAVFIALFIYAVTATARLLGTLFAFTPLRGSYSPVPGQSELVQALVFALVSWFISGALGGLHYWLLRRDIQQDPEAGIGAIRSFFLNMTEALGLLFAALLIGFFVLNNWAYGTPSNASGPLGAALATLAMVIALELERRRTSARAGAALVFQRLHFFGVQVILLIYLSFALFSNLRPLLNGLFFHVQENIALCSVDCQLSELLSRALTPLWFGICWLAYSLITLQDSSRNTRMIMHGASLAFGIGFVLQGLRTALELLLLPLSGSPASLPDIVGYNAYYDFFSPLVLGILVTLVYHFLLRDVSRRDLIGPQVRILTEWAIAGVLLAGVFWWGVGYGLYSLMQTLWPTSHTDWIATLALLITGLSYIPMDFYLLKRYQENPADATGPRRGLVLVLLGGGILSLTIGGSLALYTWGTALLGSPAPDWSTLAQQGLAGAIVGGAVIGIYLWVTLREHLITRQTQQPPSPAPAPAAAPTSIENVLDELLAGRISRDEAAKLLHALQTPLTNVLI